MTIEQFTLMALTAPAIPVARHALARQLDDRVCERTQDSILVFSELVTNAVRHAGGAVRIDVTHGLHLLRFEVHDRTHVVPEVMHIGGPAGGFGMRIVQQLARDWGSIHSVAGKVVWADLDCCLDPEPDRDAQPF